MSGFSNRPLKIVADENILLVKETFGVFGDVVTIPGRDINRASVENTDILLVRSVTQVNEELLQGTAVKFVGSATIGIDHLDIDYLNQAGITFANAPGCNAVSVVEYVFSAIFTLAKRFQFSPLEKSWGIIGCGNVGGGLYKRLKALGADVVGYDPLLQDTNNKIDRVDWSELLSREIICLHTPLTRTGQYPTHHMLGEEELSSLRPNTVLINCGRGGVINNRALYNILNKRDDLMVVLDVWEGEPQIDLALVPLIQIATPHIAGYSIDGKLNGTLIVFQMLCDFLGVRRSKYSDLLSPTFEIKKLVLKEKTQFTLLVEAITSTYDISLDDFHFRENLRGSEKYTAKVFDQLRKEYPLRPGFKQSHLNIQNGHQSELIFETERLLKTLGFSLQK